MFDVFMAAVRSLCHLVNAVMFVCFPIGNPLLSCSSAGQRSGHHQVLPVLGQAGGLGVGPELRNHRTQQPLIPTSLHRQRQLRAHVSVCPYL